MEKEGLTDKKDQAASEERLATMPAGRLMIAMSLPMMISFFIQALYNIVDSMFVAQISENALTAVSLAFPVQQMINAIAVGLGVGVNTCVPRYLAKGSRKKADQILGSDISLALMFIACAVSIGLLGTKAIYAFQTDVAEIVELGSAYLRICMSLCLGVFFGQIFEKLLVSTGRPLYAMMAQASGAVINIIFDPLLIFGIGPFPELGIKGAAAATVMGQIIAAVIALLLNLKFNTSVDIGIKYLIPKLWCVKDILKVGVPTMITMGLASFTTFVINQILLIYSTTATAVYGIWVKLQNFCYMPIYGMNNGTVPILSYNYARGLRDRTGKVVRLAVIFAACYLLILLAVLEAIPGALLSLFSASENMLSIGIRALRFCIGSLPFGGIAIICGTAMQAMRHENYALTLNILRQFVFIVGLFACISSLTGDLDMVWAAVPAAEVLSLIVSVILMRRMHRHFDETGYGRAEQSPPREAEDL